MRCGWVLVLNFKLAGTQKNFPDHSITFENLNEKNKEHLHEELKLFGKTVH